MAGEPLWLFHARPYRTDIGAPVDVWLASQTVPFDAFGGELSFAVADENFVRVPDAASLNPGSGDFAIGLRFRTGTNHGATLAAKGVNAGAGTGGPGYGLGIQNSPLVRGRISDGTNTLNLTSGSTYNDDAQHTLVMVRNNSGDDLFLYFDGSEVSGSAGNASGVGDVDTADDLLFGSNPSGASGFLEGKIERVILIVGAGVTASDVNSLLAKPLVSDLMPQTDVVGAWQMSAGHGTTVHDVSGEQNHGEMDKSGVGGDSFSWMVSPPGGPVKGRLTSPFSVRSSIISGGVLRPSSLPSFGDVVYANPDGVNDDHLDHSWKDRQHVIYQGVVGDAVADMDVRFSGNSNEPRGDKDTITVPLKGVDDELEVELQQRKYEPGFEPYVVLDGTNDEVDFGNVLNRGTGSFVFGVALRTGTKALAGVYGRKAGFGAGSAGYVIATNAIDQVVVQISDGANQVSSVVSPYSDGNRHTVVAEVNRTTNNLVLYFDGAQVDSDDITAVGSLSNAVNLFGGSTGGGNFLTGEIERFVQVNGAGAGVVARSHAALNERFADDVDASASGLNLAHYVPLTENTGTSVSDTSDSGFNGTLTNGDTETSWSGLTNGNRELSGEPVPICSGENPNVTPVLVDPVKLIYQVADEDVPTAGDGVIEVREGGSVIDEDSASPFADDTIFTTAVTAGEWAQGVVTTGDNPGLFFRLGSQPTGNITASVRVIEGGSLETTGEVVVRLMQRAPGLGVDVAGSLDIQTAAPYSTGFYSRERISTADMLDRMLGGTGFHWTIDPRAVPAGFNLPQIKMFQSKNVSAVTPVATIKLDPDDDVSGVEFSGFERVGRAPAYDRVTARFRRFEGHQPFGQLLSTVDAEERQQLSQEWRQVAVTKDHPDYTGADPTVWGADRELTFDMAANHIDRGVVDGDAKDEALRRLALHAVPPEVYQLELTGLQFEFWVGDVLEVVGSRFGMSGGKRFIIVGVTDDSDRNGSQLDLWGGWVPV